MRDVKCPKCKLGYMIYEERRTNSVAWPWLTCDKCGHDRRIKGEV